jgi:hypothetical protein
MCAGVRGTAAGTNEQRSAVLVNVSSAVGAAVAVMQALRQPWKHMRCAKQSGATMPLC